MGGAMLKEPGENTVMKKGAQYSGLPAKIIFNLIQCCNAYRLFGRVLVFLGVLYREISLY